MSTMLSATVSHPVTQALAVVAVGTVCLCFRRYRAALVLVLVAACWVFLCATPAFAELLQRGLERPYPPRPAASYPKADAIVVLGGGQPLPVNGDPDAADPGAQATRVGFGLALFREAKAPLVLLSGDGDATRMAQQLAKHGVPAAGLRLEPRSMSTHENALYSAAILESEHRLRILLVTSPRAMARAAASFRKQGLQVIAAPSLERPRTSTPSSIGSWWPRRDSLLRSSRFLHEYIGLFYYRIRGWATW